MKFSIVNIDKKKAIHLTVKTAEWFFDRITTDTKAEAVGRLRRYIAECGDNGGYERTTPIAKVFPLVELTKRENGKLDIVAYNGLVVLHVGDLMKRESMEAVKTVASQLPMTYAAFVGADGRSVEILVSVSRDDGHVPGADEGEQQLDLFCQRAYDTALDVYGGLLKTIERQRMTVRHSFRMTLDEKPFVNTGAIPLKVSAAIGHELSTGAADEDGAPSEAEQRQMDMELYADYEMLYKRVAETARAETADVIASQRHEAYLTELARLLCVEGMPQEEAFLHISNHHKYSPSYHELELRAIVDAVYEENRPTRMKEEATVSQETRQLIRFLKTRYVFRYNTVMGYTEYRPNNTWIEDWSPCDENAILDMTVDARLANLDFTEKDVRRYVRSKKKIRRSDPLEEYFWKIRDAWDGTTDHIGKLARMVPCDLPQWETWFRKWFLSMVAQWLGRNTEYGNAMVPLLISPQGDGKSSFCRNILPKELQWGYLENLMVEEKKQTLNNMHSFLLICLDEFNQISQKMQQGFLKNIIQLPRVKVKRPHAKHVEDYPRMASFIATTNEPSVLGDPTGNRRFIAVQLTAPINMANKPNYEALYAQAYQLVMENREQYWLTPDEMKALVEHNRQFEVVPPMMMYFNEYYEPARDTTDGQWLSPTAIYNHLRNVPGNRLPQNGVNVFGRYLAHYPGLQQRRMSRSTLYLVREKR